MDRRQVRAAWKALSRQQRREYRASYLTGRAASDAEVAWLIVQTASSARRQTAFRWGIVAANVIVGVAWWLMLDSLVIPAMAAVGVLCMLYVDLITSRALRLNTAIARTPDSLAP